MTRRVGWSPVSLGHVLLVEDANMVKPGAPVEVRRSWFERLFTFRPWTPGTATKTVVPMVPDEMIFVQGDTAYAHPVVARKLRAALAERKVMPMM